MADHTQIEWTDATWNPVTGCSVTSPGCTNCYAMRLAGTRLAHHWSRKGLTQEVNGNPVWTGEVRFNEEWLTQPLRWRKPRRIFVCAHGDLFHESVPWEWIARVIAVCLLSPRHTFQILTKRADRMRAWFETLETYADSDHFCEIVEDVAELVGVEVDGADWTLPLPNVWLGVSVEDQARADLRIPDLLATTAAVRWISAEPLLGAVDLTAYLPGEPFEGYCSTYTDTNGIRRSDLSGKPVDGIDWSIVGGESGPGARSMEDQWAQSIVDQCRAVSVPVFVKQLSSGGPKAIKDIDQFPTGLRVREWPNNA